MFGQERRLYDLVAINHTDGVDHIALSINRHPKSCLLPNTYFPYPSRKVLLLAVT